MAAEDKSYSPGDAVKVWSNTDNQWLSGTVRSVEDGLVAVEYAKASDSGAKMVKTLPPGSEHLKPAADAEPARPDAEEKSAGEGDGAKATPKAAPAAQAAAPVPLEKRTDFDSVVLGAALLSAISGMVNAVAILDMSSTVAHHTGNASHLGRLLGRDGLRFLSLMVAYVVGAGTASFNEFSGDDIFVGRSSDGLLGVSAAVAAGAVLKGLLGARWLALTLWCFSQGLQNGITSRFSGLALRTTHMTGALTDSGLVLGQWVQARYRGTPPPSLRKPALFLSCTLSFSAGGFLVSFLWSLFGALAAVLPAAGLALLASGRITLAKIMEFIKEHAEVVKKKIA